jgi:3-isopropylmalate/(R)-2-methylmalate dehydratase small subunit
MKSIKTIRGGAVVLAVDNIDTDQIIPARFLKVTDKVGLADGLFCDWRYDSQGKPRPDFILNQPAARSAEVLLAGDNFGCGSSREHAPWALLGFGFHAVISTSFADIFRNNALKNGLLPIQVDAETHAWLIATLQRIPDLVLEIDLEDQHLRVPGREPIPFAIENFARNCLICGVDELGYLLSRNESIDLYERRIQAPVAIIRQ